MNQDEKVSLACRSASSGGVTNAVDATSSGSGRSTACTMPTKRWLYSCSTSPDSGSGWL